ncbi:MAG: hypothetical protein AB7N80_15635 [Bdellovibrionales bacterium]
MFNKLKDKLMNETMEKSLGTIKTLFVTYAGPHLSEWANDDQKMSQAFKEVYAKIPAPIQQIVSEEKFIAFCLANKQKLIERKTA